VEQVRLQTAAGSLWAKRGAALPFGPAQPEEEEGVAGPQVELVAAEAVAKREALRPEVPAAAWREDQPAVAALWAALVSHSGSPWDRQVDAVEVRPFFRAVAEPSAAEQRPAWSLESV
jgi:hypothetical protein